MWCNDLDANMSCKQGKTPGSKREDQRQCDPSEIRAGQISCQAMATNKVVPKSQWCAY